jgi:hypothetical protein
LKVVAGGRQARTLRAPYEKWSADPIFKGTDAPAEGWLRHVPHVRRPREALQLRQRQEVLEPVEIHADAVRA